MAAAAAAAALEALEATAAATTATVEAAAGAAASRPARAAAAAAGGAAVARSRGCGRRTCARWRSRRYDFYTWVWAPRDGTSQEKEREGEKNTAIPARNKKHTPPPAQTAAFKTKTPPQKQLLTKAVTSGVISAAGNLICQIGVERRSLFQGGIDCKRLALFTALGAAYVAPVLHVWYGLLGRLVTAQGVPGALGRMGLDQLAFAPVFVGSMMTLLALADGQTPAATKKSVLEALPGAVKANWSLWVPAQYLNFRYVPPNLQVGFSNIVALAWNVYFSYATKPAAAAEPAAAAKGGKGKKGGGGKK